MFRAMAIRRFLCPIVLLSSCSITTGALGGPDLLLSYSVITIKLHITTILTISCHSISKSLNLYVSTSNLHPIYNISTIIQYLQQIREPKPMQSSRASSQRPGARDTGEALYATK